MWSFIDLGMRRWKAEGVSKFPYRMPYIRQGTFEPRQCHCTNISKRVRFVACYPTIDGVVLYAKVRRRTAPEMGREGLVPFATYQDCGAKVCGQQVCCNEYPWVPLHGAFVRWKKVIHVSCWSDLTSAGTVVVLRVVCEVATGYCNA
jgi:hypothetical protein